MKKKSNPVEKYDNNIFLIKINNLYLLYTLFAVTYRNFFNIHAFNVFKM